MRLPGIARLPAACQPALSSTTTPCASGATWRLISARCRPVAHYRHGAGRGRRRQLARGRLHRTDRPRRSGDRGAPGAGCRGAPRSGSECPADRRAPHPGTRPRPAYQSVLGRRRPRQLGEGFLKASCAAGSLDGCLGRTERRAKPSRRSTLPTERSCKRTSKRVSISAFRSIRRHLRPRLVPGPALAPPPPPIRPPARASARLWAGTPPVVEAGQTFLVVAVHPVPERRPVHAGVPRRLLHAKPPPAPAPGRTSAVPPPIPAAPASPRKLAASTPPHDRHHHRPLPGPVSPENELDSSRQAPTDLTGQEQALVLYNTAERHSAT